MDKTQNKCSDLANANDDNSSPKNKPKSRGKKRKRRSSNCSTDLEDVLPENTLEVEKNLHASAIKNNLDDASVKKILKKVVTNDHVLALVKLREEEEDSSTEESSQFPKLTRAKVKELKKVTTGKAKWNLENLELTPIKHIPVKTRPEVKALIAQELPEDEDDDEYEPTQDDVPSDDDQTLESCSDIDSQPRTPATPKQHESSPRVVKDGPFKVPQSITTAKRKLELEKEEATIALRTRSKLSLSATPIEHIESSFVPPDDLPMPAVDDLWNQFLAECLDPTPTSKHEDDDETDPEYNVAADPDAPDEDDEALENSIIKISKKELNDLVTELFSIMPEVADDPLVENIANNVLVDNNQPEVTSHWEGKQEPLSDEENTTVRRMSDRITFERRNSTTRFSIGKSEPEDNIQEDEQETETKETVVPVSEQSLSRGILIPVILKPINVVSISMEDLCADPSNEDTPPPPPVKRLQNHQQTVHVEVLLNNTPCILPEQVLILQQQLRQHVQLATSNFLQLYVHPIHWNLAPTYKEFLETLLKLANSTPNSVANVCNLKPAMELVNSWEKSVSQNTPENTEYVKFIQEDLERCRRRSINNNFALGDFHVMFKKVIANSPVFLYPYLLPPMPYRADTSRRCSYLRPEDELIVLGLDQFWQYVEANPKLYPPPARPHPRYRWGLTATVELVVHHMFPFLTARMLQSHISHIRRSDDKDNPIAKFFASREIKPVEHKILPFNPKMTMYDQPALEIPRLWLRYLAKTSPRFRSYLNRRPNLAGIPPTGVSIDVRIKNDGKKTPLPSDFTKKIVRKSSKQDKNDIQTTENNSTNMLQPVMATNFYKLEQTSTGTCLVPLMLQTNTVEPAIVTTQDIQISVVSIVSETVNNITSNHCSHNVNVKTNTVNSTHTPISSTLPVTTPYLTVTPATISVTHCKCCVLLRKMCKRQSYITDYFSKDKVKSCFCNNIKYPKITNRLKLLVNMYKDPWRCGMQALQTKLANAERDAKLCIMNKKEDTSSEVTPSLSNSKEDSISLEDLVFVLAFKLKLISRMGTLSTTLKITLNTILSNFDPEHDDPVLLAKGIEESFKGEQVGMFHEFLGFLTPEQADSCGKFKEYFIQYSLAHLVKLVDEQVKECERRRSILTRLQKSLNDPTMTSCQLCTSLLPTLNNYPSLAKYVFSLFPHKRIVENGRNENNVLNIGVVSSRCSEEKDQKDNATTEEHQISIDYEADHSSSGEDVTSDTESIRESQTKKPVIATEHTNSEPSRAYELDKPQSTINNTEVQDYSDTSDVSMVIASEDESIKSERSEWKRDEDKLILEVLKSNITPEERKDKTIIEIIEERELFQMISESMSYKSIDEIKQRVMYLLEVLLLREK